MGKFYVKGLFCLFFQGFLFILITFMKKIFIHLSQIMVEAILGMVYTLGLEMDSVTQSQKKKIQQVVERILDKI